MNIRASVVGAAGFAGIELVRLLLRHPDFEVASVTSDALAGTPVSQAYPAFAGQTDLVFSACDDAAFDGCDVAFLAVPHTASLGMAPGLLARGVSVIDLSADFRLKDPATYERWYKTPHTAPRLLPGAAFGLPELARGELGCAAAARAEGKAALVACAGCYPTATSLAAAPALASGLVDGAGVVVVDAVSGVTGAGKKATERTHFCFADGNVEAYGVGTHRHTPEIEQILRIPGRVVSLRTSPARARPPVHGDAAARARRALPRVEDLVERYAAFYADDAFVQVLPAGTLPRTASVVGTNRAHVGVGVAEGARAIVAVGAIDNLGKGAAGQAVQCANVVFGLPRRVASRPWPCRCRARREHAHDFVCLLGRRGRPGRSGHLGHPGAPAAAAVAAAAAANPPAPLHAAGADPAAAFPCTPLPGGGVASARGFSAAGVHAASARSPAGWTWPWWPPTSRAPVPPCSRATRSARRRCASRVRTFPRAARRPRAGRRGARRAAWSSTPATRTRPLASAASKPPARRRAWRRARLAARSARCWWHPRA